MQIIYSNNEEYFVVTAPSKSRSVKHELNLYMNNSYIETSSVVFDYAKCTDKLSSVLQEKEKKAARFLLRF